MNIQKYDVVNEILKHPKKKQRELAEATGYSVGKVNSSVKQLKEEGYLDSDMRITEKVREEMEEKSPRNAVILDFCK